MARTSTEKTNGSQFSAIALPPDADFKELREFAHDLARQKFDAADGDRQVALDDLMKMGKARPDILEALQTVAFHELWQDYLRQCGKHQRHRIEHSLQENSGARTDPWTPAETLGEGMAAKRRNMDTVYDYQFPFLAKSIGIATRVEFSSAVEKITSRATTDKKFIELGKTIETRIAKASKDALIKDIVPAEELVRLFRQSGVVT